jgi:lipopolysaccharide assembly outer membrane protein LptD (OstA)
MLLILLLCITPFSADKVEIIKENGESIVLLSGNVVIEDEKAKITCAEARLNETRDYVILTQDVRITDVNGQIHADFARYHFMDEKGFLKGNVSLQRTDQLISSDSLYYDGFDDYVEMFGDVKIEDYDNNLTAHGERGWYNIKDEEGYLVDRPLLEIIRKDREPIRIYAQQFQLNNSSNVFHGFDSVVAVIDSITVYCDTFLYNLDTEAGDMKRPFIVEDNNELKGESGQFKMNNKSIESLSVRNGWSQYYTEEGSKNIIEGETIKIMFKDGKASHIIVDGEPKGVLHLKQEEENARHQESE